MCEEGYKETVGIDVVDYYACDVENGVSDPWQNGGVRLFHGNDANCDIGSMFRHDKVISRVGLVLACSDPAITRQLLTDACLELQIDRKRGWSAQFAAFADATMGNMLLDGHVSSEHLILSSSLPVDPHVPIPRQQSLTVQIVTPVPLDEKIRLKERDVFAYLVRSNRTKPDYCFPKPDWFIRIGVRIIGKKIRPMPHLVAVKPRA